MVNRRDAIKMSLLGLSSLALSHNVKAQAPTKYGIVGRKAPELTIDYWIDKDGKSTQFNVSDHQGKWVFLKCFQSWCPGCHSHGLPAVKKISEALVDNPNIVFAGIQTVFEGHFVNTIAKVRKTQVQYNLQFPMGHDVDEDDGAPSTMRNYRTGGTPWMILINPEGYVVFNDFGINEDKAIEYLKDVTKA